MVKLGRRRTPWDLPWSPRLLLALLELLLMTSLVSVIMPQVTGVMQGVGLLDGISSLLRVSIPGLVTVLARVVSVLMFPTLDLDMVRHAVIARWARFVRLRRGPSIGTVVTAA